VNLFVLNNSTPLRIGDTVPNFVQESTKGPFNLHEHAGGSWCVIFVHPKQYPAVSTSEVVEIEKMQQEWMSRKTKIVSLSQDNLENTKEWIKDLQEQHPDIKFQHPWIADQDFMVAKLLSLISAASVKSGTKPEDLTQEEEQDFASRLTLFIDPQLQLRAHFMYPSCVGRSTHEVLRLLDAVQLADKKKVSLPANWRPGDKVLVLNKDVDHNEKPRNKYMSVHL